MKKKLIVFTGAGISAESGLATFRDSNGLWENYRPEDVAHIDAWNRDPELVIRFYNERRKQALAAEPNDAHYALAQLEEHFDVQIITQNVDDLHERAGSSQVLHLHGEITKLRPENDVSVTYPYDKDLALGDQDEHGYQLRPHVVWFGEMVPNIIFAETMVRDADIFVVIGTSLNVYPAANLLGLQPVGSPAFIVNPEQPTGFMNMEFTFIKERATIGVPQLKNILVEQYR